MTFLLVNTTLDHTPGNLKFILIRFLERQAVVCNMVNQKKLIHLSERENLFPSNLKHWNPQRLVLQLKELNLSIQVGGYPKFLLIEKEMSLMTFLL